MRYVKALFRRILSLLYLSLLKIFHINTLKFSPLQLISLSTRFVINKGNIHFGRKIGTRRNVEFRVSNGGKITVGNNSFFNNGCLINSMAEIKIGSNVQFGPNVMVYDHDHDFRVNGGIKSGKYRKSPIVIGNNVWIGAGCVILRGTTIGENSIVAAGSVIKGDLPPNTIITQKRNNTLYEISTSQSKNKDGNTVEKNITSN
jgi:acetyltransferase-like isoleucine patch superfamily enzyme